MPDLASGDQRIDACIAKPVPVRAHHLAHAPRGRFESGLAVYGGGPSQKRPACRLAGRVGDGAGPRRRKAGLARAVAIAGDRRRSK